MEENYSEFARVYDEIMDDSLYDKWLAFSERHFSKETHKILELACGTGILSAKFANAGYEVTGLDLSEQMLDIARGRAKAVNFELGDMRNLPYNTQFDAVTCFSDSLCYLSDLTDLSAAFDGVYRALTRDGVFIFDVHSTYMTDVDFPGFAYHDNAEDFAFIWDSYAGEVAHSIVHELTFFIKQADGRFVRKDEVHKERTYDLSDYHSELTKAGFKAIEIFADFEDKAPEADSKRWFFVCQK